MPLFTILADRVQNLEFTVEAPTEEDAVIIAEELIHDDKLPVDCIIDFHECNIDEVNEVGNFGD